MKFIIEYVHNKYELKKNNYKDQSNPFGSLADGQVALKKPQIAT